MRKVFMFLYPIEEFMNYFTKSDGNNIIEKLNETIDKRYRKNGYEIVYVIYPDKSISGINIKPTDIVINTDIEFATHIKKQEDGSYIYPNEKYIINQLGQIDELIVGGFHFSDCVKRVGEFSLVSGINTLVDLDLTDLFLGIYKTDYFNISKYDTNNFKEYMISKFSREDYDFALRLFNRKYSSDVYGFNKENYKKSK